MTTKSPRFYSPDLPETGSTALDGLEAHHLMHVLRCKPGDVVELFNGNGRTAIVEVVNVRKRDAELRIVESREIARPATETILATAVPKGDRLDWLIEKATELGVTRFIPLTTQRSVVDPRESKLDKLKQTVIAACKQSGRNHLMEVSATTRWDEFCRSIIPDHATFLAHPEPDAQVVSPALLQDAKSLVFAVGPEGGFTDAEVALAVKAGAVVVSLGPQILRIETAALAVAACRALS